MDAQALAWCAVISSESNSDADFDKRHGIVGIILLEPTYLFAKAETMQAKSDSSSANDSKSHAQDFSKKLLAKMRE